MDRLDRVWTFCNYDRFHRSSGCPVNRKWVVEFGIIACILVISYGFIMGYVRGIPSYWSFIDSLFGICGVIRLLVDRTLILRIDNINQKSG